MRRTLTIALALLSSFVAMGQSPTVAPKVGQRAPNFSLSTPTGKSVNLASLVKMGPVALIVLRGYPGYQCPYCVRQVHEFVESADAFAAAGAQVLLIYPGPPANLDQHAKEFLAKQNPLPRNVTLVIDPNYTFTNQYRLRWDAPNETAYPATFLIDRKGVIIYRKVSYEHGDRTTASSVLRQLRNAQGMH
jgi:peroxiredoxin